MLGGIASLRRRWWAQHHGAVKPRPLRQGPRQSARNRARSGAISGHPQHHGRHGRGQDGDRRGEHRHRKGRPPQQPLTTGLLDRRPRQGRGHCWSHLDAHQDDAPSQALVRTHVRAPVKERQDSNPVPGDAVGKRRGHKRERSAVLRASGEWRVNARLPAAAPGTAFFNRAGAFQ